MSGRLFVSLLVVAVVVAIGTSGFAMPVAAASGEGPTALADDVDGASQTHGVEKTDIKRGMIVREAATGHGPDVTGETILKEGREIKTVATGHGDEVVNILKSKLPR